MLAFYDGIIRLHLMEVPVVVSKRAVNSSGHVFDASMKRVTTFPRVSL